MALFAVTSLIRTIELEFLPPNPRFVFHHTEAAEALHRRLRVLLAVLQESESQFNADDDIMTDLETLIKDGGLRIEDQIELKVIATYQSLDLSMMSPCSMDLAAFFVYNWENEIAQWIMLVEENKDSRVLREDLQMEDNLPPSTEDLQMKDIPSSSGDVQMKGILSSSERIKSSSSLESTMVGHSDDLDHIKWMLLRDTPKGRLVVPIVGMGGIGKTTFAQRLYADPAIVSHFDNVAWTTMSARYDERRVLLQLLSSMPMTDHCYDISELRSLLHRCLMGTRYLIVVDDIWSTGSWDDIQRCFPESNGSRILLTSRHREVGSYASLGNYSLDMRFLTSDESWQLFHQRVVNYEKLPAKLKRILEHIIAYCKGLPLAVLLIAGLVQVNDESLWESKDIATIFFAKASSDLVEGISEILNLSYNHLPHFLKACFLYLGVFPEDSTIHMKKLTRLWIAEGFVMVEGEKSLEEIAEDYLKDLVSRSLVLINSINLDGKIKTCKVHDMVHDFCKRKAMEEGLLHVVEYSQLHSPASDCRWVSFQTMKADGVPIFGQLKFFNSCRSNFWFLGGDQSFVYSYDIIRNFKMLRVLDLSTFPSNINMMSDIANLVLLRYLALWPYWSCSNRENVWELQKNWNLQTLVLLADKQHRRVNDNPLTYEILGNPKLRHLQVSIEFSLLAPTAVQEHLQTIYWLPHFQCTEQVFLRIPNVKVMGIVIQRSVNHRVDPPNWLDNLRYLPKLEKLKIKSRCNPNPILLPNAASAFPVQLRKLTLKGTLVPWNAMEVIAVLPNLECLQLKYGACQGEDWKVSGGGFCKLKSLLIHGTQLMQWTATGNDFPILERLIIKECLYLKEIPSSFEDIYTLQLIELHHCPSQLVTYARQIQAQQQEFGNDVLIVRDYDYTRVNTEEKEQKRRGADFDELMLRLSKMVITEEKEKKRRGDFEEQECVKTQKDEDAELAFHHLANADFFNCFEDDLDDTDIN